MRECPHCKICYEDSLEQCDIDGHKLLKRFSGPALLDNKYLLLRILGKGGMGAVYLANHIGLNRKFAVKLIHPKKSHNDEYLQRFQLEAKALGLLKHPNIVDVTDYGVDPRKIPYLVMEYMEGFSLEQHIRKKARIPIEEALSILHKIASGLDFAHQGGVLHRDLKPGNIFLVEASSGDMSVKIMDFGLARFLEPDLQSANAITRELEEDGDPAETLSVHDEVPAQKLTLPGMIMGTPGYMSPEIFESGKVSVASDIFGFGVIAFQMMTGRLPYTGSPAEMLKKMLTGPPHPSEIETIVPAEMTEPLRASLEREITKRPSTARLAVNNLQSAHQLAALRLWKRTELPLRLALSLALAVLLIGLLVVLNRFPNIAYLENAFFDFRIALLPVEPPDPRMILLSIDETTLAADPTPLAAKAEEAGALLNAIGNSGPFGIAIDLTLPNYWSESEKFTQFVIENAKRLSIAIQSDAERVIGTDFTQGPVMLALGEDQTRNLFGIANVSEDRDGVVRKFRYFFRDRDGRQIPSFAFRSARLLESSGEMERDTLWINYSIDTGKLPRISWNDAPDALRKTPDIFRDKLVLVGAEFTGSGDFFERVRHPSLPHTQMSGLELQALIVNNLLKKDRIHSAGSGFYFVLFVFICASLFPLLYSQRKSHAILIVFAFILIYVGVAFSVFYSNLLLVPVALPILSLILGGILASLLRMKLRRHPLPATTSM